MKKLITLLAILICTFASGQEPKQYIDANNTEVVGLQEKGDTIATFDGEGKLGYILKENLTPNLDDVLSKGNTSTTSIIIENLTGRNTRIQPLQIDVGYNNTSSRLSMSYNPSLSNSAIRSQTSSYTRIITLREESIDDAGLDVNSRISGLSGVNDNDFVTVNQLNEKTTSWDEITGDQSDISLSGFTNDLGYGTMSAEDADDYYTKTQVNDTLSNYPLYDEGTWSGTIEGTDSGSISTGTQNYIKIGNQVTLYFNWTGDLSGLTGNISIGLLPTFGNNIVDRMTAIVGHDAGILYPVDAKTLYIETITDNIWFYFIFDDSNRVRMTDANIDGTSHLIRFTLTYRITP